MIARDDLANRHSLAADGLSAPAGAETMSVRVVVSDVCGASHAGQLLVSCLANLLCRAAGIVRSVEVVARTTRLLVALPSGETDRQFPDCLEEISLWAVDNVVPVSATSSSERTDATIFIGGRHDLPEITSGKEIIAVGERWRAWVGDRASAPLKFEPRSANPLGPFLAAALAAGEVFKHSRGIKRGRPLASNGYSLWSGRTSADWHDLEDGPELAGNTLPPIHVIGGGAVGNGFAYVIANAGLRDGYLIVIDDDTYDGTNLNRCLMAGWRDLQHPKPDAIDRGLRRAGVGCYPFPHAIQNYVIDARAGLREDAAAEADNLQFKIVASCVDRGISRQNVQSLWPDLLLGGSTLDLRAQANVYGLWNGSACLGCYNPAERDGDKIRELEQTLRNMPKEDRIAFLKARDLDADAISEYLANPTCGGVGEAALREFAIRPPRDFSVGFVSLGAALLLSGAVFQQVLFRQQMPERMDRATLNFLTGGFADSGSGADPDCQLQCSTREVH